MSESRDLVPVAPLLITVIAVIGVTSTVWSIFWQRHNAGQHEQLAQLQQRLDRIESERSQLIERYTAAEQSRHDREVELLALKNELADTRKKLKDIEESNWPERYADLEQKNYELSEQIEELKLRNSISRDNYLAEYDQLQDRHEKLQENYAELEHDHAVLEERLDNETATADRQITELRQSLAEARHERQQMDHLQHALQRDLIDREIGDSALESRLAGLEQERQSLQASLAESEQRIQALSRQNKALDTKLAAARETAATPPPVRKIASEPPPEAVTAAATAHQADPGFRLARIQSLRAAVQDASSSDRKSILLTVLPSIPGGVDGTELADLVAGMESRHIVEVIQAGRPHIQRPVDNDSYERIMQQLEDEDSRRLVTRLLQ